MNLVWEKLGKIFDPRDHTLPNGCIEYAQSPQTLVFESHIRIYFSSRQRDPTNGKFLSHICYADFSKDLKHLLRVSEKQVIPLGNLGCFDEHGIFPMNVLRHAGMISAYTSGWTRRVSVSVDTGIGLAYSHDDGETFQRIGDGPVLCSSLREPFLVGDPFVQVHDGLFHMWYIFGTDWKTYPAQLAPDRTYKIGHATSSDGVTWRKSDGVAIIPDRLHADESQALPTVVEINGRHHMIFCYRESADFRTGAGKGYRLGHAWSDDLKTWTRDDHAMCFEGVDDGWDSEMMCYPHLFKSDESIWLLYNGNEFGKHGFGAARLK